MTDFNGGKDIMPSDILVEKVKGVSFLGQKEVESEAYRAFIAFQPLLSRIGEISFEPSLAQKFYVSAFANTEQEAINDLVDLLVEHLTRLKK